MPACSPRKDIEVISHGVKGAIIPDIVQFSSAVYYCNEGEGHVDLEVQRLGDASSAVRVAYCTESASAVAGRKFLFAKGLLYLAVGESSKTIQIQLIEDEAFDATLEFGVVLSKPDMEVQNDWILGTYLFRCRIVIADDDAFPTNKFTGAHYSRVGWPLMIEYFRMHLTDAKFRQVVYLNVVTDQISNLKYTWQVLIVQQLIDHVLASDDDEETVFWNVTFLVFCSLVPNIVVFVLEYLKVTRRMREMAVSKLQSNLLRKFLNYTDASRMSTATSDLTLAIIRDVPDLVDSGFYGLMKVIGTVGLLVQFACSAVMANGMDLTLFIPLFLCFPLSMLIFLKLRKRVTQEYKHALYEAELDIIAFTQESTDCCRLASDYGLRPMLVSTFSLKVAAANAAFTRLSLWMITNRAMAPSATSCAIALFIAWNFQAIADGGPIGEFVTGIAIWKSIGQCYQLMYDDLLSMQSAMEPLINIIHFMNLPVDVAMHMEHTRWLLGESIKPHCDRDRCVPGVPSVEYAVDRMKVWAKDISFCYPTEDQTEGRVLDSAAFQIPQGNLVAVISSRRGAGKATLLSLLARVLVPTSTCADQSGSGSGSLFVPPHLRVLHVCYEPMLLSDLTLFENICFGPSDGPDEAASRVLRICERLQMSTACLTQIRRETGSMASLNCIDKGAATDNLDSNVDVGEDRTSRAGTAASVAQRRGQERKAKMGYFLSHTDKCLIHVARALVMNPEVLVMHKPLAQFDNVHAPVVTDALRKFVDERGIEQAFPGDLIRRPRTCIFSTSTAEFVKHVDLVLAVNQGKVKREDIEEWTAQRERVWTLFNKLDPKRRNRITREDFLGAASRPEILKLMLPMLHISPENTRDPNKLQALLDNHFTRMDHADSGEVDLERLDEHVRDTQQTQPIGWKLPDVPCEGDHSQSVGSRRWISPAQMPLRSPAVTPFGDQSSR